MKESIDNLAKVFAEDDLSQLSVTDRLFFYKQVCASIGLNPLTQPFRYIWLKGPDGQKRLTFYATKGCTDQLRQIYNISLQIISRKKEDGLYTVTARATIGKDGRQDEDIGCVSLMIRKKDGQGTFAASGDTLANLYMKCETKAKRRVTLSICGLGLVDESEIETIPDAVVVSEQKQKSELVAEIKRLILEHDISDEKVHAWLERENVARLEDLSLRMLSGIVLKVNSALKLCEPTEKETSYEEMV